MFVKVRELWIEARSRKSCHGGKYHRFSSNFKRVEKLHENFRFRNIVKIWIKNRVQCSVSRIWTSCVTRIQFFGHVSALALIFWVVDNFVKKNAFSNQHSAASPPLADTNHSMHYTRANDTVNFLFSNIRAQPVVTRTRSDSDLNSLLSLDETHSETNILQQTTHDDDDVIVLQPNSHSPRS